MPVSGPRQRRKNDIVRACPVIREINGGPGRPAPVEGVMYDDDAQTVSA
jgi:hypothetical protein